MTIYEAGESVRIQLLKDSCAYRTNVVVLDTPYDYTMQEAFSAMQEYLKMQGIGITEVLPEVYTLKAGQDTYQVAHEVVVTPKGKVKYKPSNILRHVFGRAFTIDSLYIENNSIVDLTQSAISDVNNFMLKYPGKDVVAFINRCPDYLVECFKQKYLNNYSYHENLKNAMFSIEPVRPLQDFNELMNLISNTGLKLLDEINRNSALKEYLVDRCGMKFTASFDPINFKVRKSKEPKMNDDMYYIEPDIIERAAKPMKFAIE